MGTPLYTASSLKGLIPSIKSRQRSAVIATIRLSTELSTQFSQRRPALLPRPQARKSQPPRRSQPPLPSPLFHYRPNQSPRAQKKMARTRISRGQTPLRTIAPQKSRIQLPFRGLGPQGRRAATAIPTRGLGNRRQGSQ